MARYDRGAAEAARFALMGLLTSGPSYGYDLARRFAPDAALGTIVHLGASHLYSLLLRLERDGLIAGERQEAGSRPQRRVYRLTPEGQVALMHWIDEPVNHPRDMRIEFPLKLYTARHVSPESVADLIERQRQAFTSYIQRVEATRGEARDSDDAVFIDLMRDGRIGRARAALEWLDAACRLPPVGER